MFRYFFLSLSQGLLDWRWTDLFVRMLSLSLYPYHPKIEHHLFPSVSCDKLFPLIPIVKATCMEFGVEYKDYPTFSSILASTHRYIDSLALPSSSQPLQKKMDWDRGYRGRDWGGPYHSNDNDRCIYVDNYRCRWWMAMRHFDWSSHRQKCKVTKIMEKENRGNDSTYHRDHFIFVKYIFIYCICNM